MTPARMGAGGLLNTTVTFIAVQRTSEKSERFKRPSRDPQASTRRNLSQFVDL